MTDNARIDFAAGGSRNYPRRWLRRWEPAGEPHSEERTVWVAMNIRLDEGRTMTDDEITQTRAAWHIRQAQLEAGVRPEQPAAPATSAAALARALRMCN